MYSPPAPCLDFTAINSAISLGAVERAHQTVLFSATHVVKRDILLQLPPLVSELSDLGEENADLACEGFAEVIQVPAEADRAR